MDIEIRVYDQVKYNAGSNVTAKAVYKNIQSMIVKEIEDAEIIDQGFDDVDEYKEYCIVTLEDGDTATFRNSHVDVFSVR